MTAFSSMRGTSLFGKGFNKRAKERDEELKCLNQAGLGGKSSRPPKTNFFEKAAPPLSLPVGVANSSTEGAGSKGATHTPASQAGSQGRKDSKRTELYQYQCTHCHNIHSRHRSADCHHAPYKGKLFTQPYAIPNSNKVTGGGRKPWGRISGNETQLHGRDS